MWYKKLNNKGYKKDMTYWLKSKILGHLKATGKSGVSVRRDYLSKTVVVDYFGGACVKYSYDGKWLCG